MSEYSHHMTAIDHLKTFYKVKKSSNLKRKYRFQDTVFFFLIEQLIKTHKP